MKSPLRIAAAAAAAGLTLGMAAPATAAGHEGSGDLGTQSRVHVSSKEKQTLSLIKMADKTLVRISESGQVACLNPDNLSVVLNNLAADRAALAKMTRVVKKTHKPATIKAVHRNLTSFHAQNYTDSANLLDLSEDLLGAVAQERENLTADDTFSPEERAALSARIDAVEAHVKSAVAQAQGLTARSAQPEVRNVELVLDKAEDDLGDVDDVIYNN
jgi:hypothetical protein